MIEVEQTSFLSFFISFFISFSDTEYDPMHRVTSDAFMMSTRSNKLRRCLRTASGSLQFHPPVVHRIFGVKSCPSVMIPNWLSNTRARSAIGHEKRDDSVPRADPVLLSKVAEMVLQRIETKLNGTDFGR